MGRRGCKIGGKRSLETMPPAERAARAKKAAAQSFKALERVRQLHSGLPHGIARFTKLIGVSDGESDSFNRDANLIGHLKFHR